MSSKKIVANYPVIDVIASRWSPRAFSDQVIGDDALGSLLEAARWAPSCFNDQPWSFIVARENDADEFDRMLQCLLPSNQRWAANASVLMISVARLHFDHNNKANRHAFHDIGLAVGQLVLQALSMGIGVHQIGGIDVEKIRATYAIPEGYEPVTGLVLGYFGDPNSLPDDLRERELAARKRHTLNEIIYTGHWGHRVSWLK